MKAKKITYSRLISKGNYENAKIEIELEVEEGETAGYVFQCAKEWVNSRVEIEKTPELKMEWAKKVLSDRRNNTIANIEEAESVLEQNARLDDGDLPF
jgi:hypothetical protein